MANFNLRDICHVCSNEDGDRFVGVKADAKGAAVYFPLGYQLPPVSKNESALRLDIMRLIFVLSAFNKQKENLLAIKKFFAPQKTDFPANAYMTVIADYMARSYYAETEIKYVTSDSGKIDWRKTMRKHQPVIQSNGSLIYTKFEVRNFASNDRMLITCVHEFCVYEAFQKLGWLFSVEMPRRPQLKLEGNKNMFLGVVRDKMARTFIDKDKQLFQSMIDMLEFLDEYSPQSRYYFGTDSFEYVWEHMIDKIFGIKNKRAYFPRTHWRYLHSGSQHDNDALEPDTIMIPPEMKKAFVLDAKYYRYGATGNKSHLPPSSSINKQITYGEYVSQSFGKDMVFNAFLMPYNGTEYDNKTAPCGNKLGLSGEYACVGEAYGDWKTDGWPYEAVQGIVVDTRCLMYHYTENSALRIKLLADTILAAYERHRSIKLM